MDKFSQERSNNMRIKHILDLSQDIYHDCPVAPDLTPPEIKLTSIGAKDGWTNEQITMTPHTGTHMDSPSHVGELTLTLDNISVDQFYGNMVLVPLEKEPLEPITVADLKPYEEQFNSDAIVMLYTGWGEKRGWNKDWLYNLPYLSIEASKYLVGKKVKGIGIDNFSIGGFGEDNWEIHKIILGADIWVVENVELDNPLLRTGDWYVFSLPVKIKDCSGAPCRVVAIQYEE